MKKITLPLSQEEINSLNAGDNILITGTIYTARDCAHKRLYEMIEKGDELPIKLQNQTIYYAGPCPTPKGKASGSCGPTTSGRMEKYAPTMLEHGLKCIIGKGDIGPNTVKAVVDTKGVYFCAIGGAGAYYGNCVKKNTLIAFEDLLSEAIYEFQVEDFPVIVGVDNHGGTIFNR